MKDFVKQYDTGHITDRLYVHWDVSTQCQFKCTYCYAMKEYNWESNDAPGDWNKIDSWDRQKLVIGAISRSSLPIFLGLQGGEPTIHPKYDMLISKCHEAISKHEEGRLYVTTNGLRGPAFFESKPYYDKLMFLWSFHTEYADRYGPDFHRIIDSIKVCIDKGHRCRINIMLHSNKKYWKILHRFTDIVEQIPNAEIHPHWIYEGGDPHAGVIDYTDQFYSEFKRFEKYPSWLTFEDKSGNTNKLNDYEIFLTESFNFRGWKCWHNNYEITWNGKILKACALGNEANLVISPFYFKNIKKIIPAICPHTCCACDGHLKIYKERI